MLMTTTSSTVRTILLYSDDSSMRADVQGAVGNVADSQSTPIRWIEVATHAEVVRLADLGGIDLIILDGEADKVGGMGVCRQLKNEIFNCPPVIILTGRAQDAWLASWSLADFAVARPLDPIELQRVVRGALKNGVSAGAAL
jgi:DNA-binding response OmpR family regulator